MKTHMHIIAAGFGLGTALLAVGAQAQVRVQPAEDEPYCREFTQTVTIGGKMQQGYGTACLQPDGSWEIQKPVQTRASKSVNVREEQPNIRYVVQKERVFIVPPRPFVVGTVWVGGRVHRFDDDFRPRWQPEMYRHGGHRPHGPAGNLERGHGHR